MLCSGCAIGEFITGDGDGGIPRNMVDVTPGWYNMSGSDIAARGGYAYVADWNSGLQIFDVSNPDDPVWVAKLKTEGQPSQIVIAGNYAYLTAGEGGLHIIYIGNPGAPSIVKTMMMENYPYGVAVEGEFLYAATGNQTGSSPGSLVVIDISTPESVEIIASVETPGRALDVDIENGYAYVAAESSGLRIMDVDPPGLSHEVSVIGEIEFPSFMGGEIFDVVVSNGLAFVHRAGGEMNPNHLGVINVENPEEPVWVENFSFGDYISGSGDIVIDGDYLYMSYGEDLRVYDFSSHDSAVLIDTITGAGGNYTLADGMAYVVSNGLTVVDLHDPANGIIRGIRTGFSAGQSLEAVDGLLLQGYYGHFSITDISDPENPEIKSIIEDEGHFGDFVYQDNLVYMLGPGIDIYNISNPELPVLVQHLDTPSYPNGLAVAGNYIYVTDDDGLHVIDNSDPELPVLTDSIEVGEGLWLAKITVSGDYAYCLERQHGVYIFDVSVPSELKLANEITPVPSNDFIVVPGGYVYLSCVDGIRIIDIDPMEDAAVVKTYPDIHGIFEKSGPYLYIAYDKLYACDIGDPSNPVFVSFTDLYGYTNDISVSGKFAYISGGWEYLQIIRLW